MAYKWSVAGIFVSGTCMAVSSEVDIPVGCVLHIYTSMLDLCTHVERGQCALYLHCGVTLHHTNCFAIALNSL